MTRLHLGKPITVAGSLESRQCDMHLVFNALSITNVILRTPD